MQRLRLPLPANWQDFEALCLHLWRELWDDPNAQKNGREGQPQGGVDIFGSPRGSTECHGVQCKLRSSVDRQLTQADVREEVRKAEAFKPPLHSFTLATTAPRDTELQEKVRLMSLERLGRGRFPVHLYSWDDILDALEGRHDLILTLYPEFRSAGARVATRDDGALVAIVHQSGNPMLDCAAIFDDPVVRSAIVEELRLQLRDLTTELILNAFQHGNARRCDILLRSDTLVLVDDGEAFDVSAACHSAKTRAGLTYVRHFLETWKGEIGCSYFRSGGKNITTLAAGRPWSASAFSRTCTVMVKARYTSGPLLDYHAEFRRGCSEYLLVVPIGLFNPSCHIADDSLPDL